jgi:hypothetical protein
MDVQAGLLGTAAEKVKERQSSRLPLRTRPEGLEPPAYRSATCRSNPLSYGRSSMAPEVYQPP